MNRTEFQTIVDWMIDGARSASGLNQLMTQACERSVAAGLPLWRVAVFVWTLHPDMFGIAFFWRPGAEVTVATANFDPASTPEFRRSPLAILQETGREVRYRLDDPETKRFPFLDDMRAEGVTDYIALPLVFIQGSIHASSWTTREPGGFTDEHLDALRLLVRPLARMVEIISLRRTATTRLDTYVGNRAGERILGGQIRRGHTETMQAAIWLSDLRGFTALSDRLAPEIVVDILNRYFDCQVPVIRKHGGEILKFMGDGLLAVFPIARDGGNLAEVCGRVLEAAREARASVGMMEHSHEAAIERFRFGVALHIGGILFGNIGGSNRLDFTCIGPAVNLAARMEKIAGQLGRTVVASEAFAGVCRGEWTDLGEFPIAGMAIPQRVYGLSDESANT
jgi:adenylate cyclase